MAAPTRAGHGRRVNGEVTQALPVLTCSPSPPPEAE